MSKTIVYQSYRLDNIPPWISSCLESVESWATLKGWDYRFIGDEIFDLVPDWYRDKAQGKIPVVTDLGRLMLARRFLDEGFERAIWIDADMLIFDPDGFSIAVESEYAFGRETWVQPNGKGGLKVYHNVHNALSVYCEGNSFLDFYIHACLSVMDRLEAEDGPVNQIVGPKLLNALNNMIGLPLVDDAGMISPLVLRDLDAGGGPALELMRSKMPERLRAANLCGSLVGGSIDGVDMSDAFMARVVGLLLATKDSMTPTLSGT